jgi:hypothetical protein
MESSCSRTRFLSSDFAFDSISSLRSLEAIASAYSLR